ncbi:MAG: hypothetical protein ACFWTN_07505 [Clostridium sp.]|jgi:hypothetical protein
MDNKKKICPLFSIMPNQLKQDCTCIESECAWWCERTGSCAMTPIPDVKACIDKLSSTMSGINGRLRWMV